MTDAYVHFRRTGGLAGVPVEAQGQIGELDLPEEVRARLRALASGDVEGSDGTAAPDGFTYVIRIERGGVGRELRWTDGGLPVELVAVVRSLGRLARPVSPER